MPRRFGDAAAESDGLAAFACAADAAANVPRSISEVSKDRVTSMSHGRALAAKDRCIDSIAESAALTRDAWNAAGASTVQEQAPGWVREKGVALCDP